MGAGLSLGLESPNLLVPLIATAPCEYDGKRYAAGASFSAYNPEDAKVLVLLGKASYVDRAGYKDETGWNCPPGDDGHLGDLGIVEPVRPKRVYRRRTVPVQDSQE